MKLTALKHIGQYRIAATYENGDTRLLDFEDFLQSSSHPLIRKFLDVELFKTVYLDSTATPCWGDNEMDINPESILNGNFDLKG